MAGVDRISMLQNLLVEMKVATQQELDEFLADETAHDASTFWGHLQSCGRLTRPQGDTLEMAAKGYIPVEAARVSINVQGRISHGSDSRGGRVASPAGSASAEQSTARNLLKIQRSARGSFNAPYADLEPLSKSLQSRPPTPKQNTTSPSSNDEIEALALDQVGPGQKEDSPAGQPEGATAPEVSPRERARPGADPSSVAAWKQIVDSLPRSGSSRSASGSATPPLSRPATIPNWLATPKPREGGGHDRADRSASSRSAKPPGGSQSVPGNGRGLSGLVGRRLGKFQLSSQIGKGSSGSVYLGHHVVLNMPVAIKVLDPAIAAFHPELLKRFKHEARSAARIAHPNIIRVVDCDQIEGYHIIVMEYVDGISVSELVKINGQIAEERALIIVQAVAEGLEAALECGIIHRDIKPANIMITKNKQVKLADLGLAKRVDDPTDMSDTRPNIGLGTPHYFAPEQASNAASVDHRADIYSLGATLYNMLTGSVPFKGKTIAELIHKHQEEPVVPPHQIVPHLSKATSDLTLYMMAKRPDDRPQNYADLLNAINASIYNAKNRESRTESGSKAGTTIVRDILNLFSTRK